MQTQLELDRVEQVSIEALKTANARHNVLGIAGTEPLPRKNRFGDTPMRGDVEAEEVVLDHFKHFGLPVRFVSEEHGRVELSANPEYLAVLDGVDGSARYSKQFGTGTYATLLGVFPKTNPIYRDYIFSGMMLHGTKQLFYSVMGGESFVLNIETGEVNTVLLESSTELDSNTRIHIHHTVQASREAFGPIFEGGFNTVEINSYSACYSEILAGKASLVLTCTGKDNLEPAAVYGLFTRAGGVMETLDGRDLGEREYLTFGQDQQVPIIIAANREIAESLRNRLRI